MINKPKPIRHMVLWGALAGQILAVLYIAGFINFAGFGSLLELLEILFSPGTWLMASLFGLIPGIILGYFDGMLLKKLIDNNHSQTFTDWDMENKRWIVYGGIFTLTVVMSLFIFPMFSGLFRIPAFIAASAATYAAHRYMFRLRLWNEQQGIGKSKTKRKNDDLTASRLMEQSPDENRQSPYVDSKKQGQRAE